MIRSDATEYSDAPNSRDRLSKFVSARVFSREGPLRGFGSIASVWPSVDNFRFSPGSGHLRGRSACLKSAISGLWPTDAPRPLRAMRRHPNGSSAWPTAKWLPPLQAPFRRKRSLCRAMKFHYLLVASLLANASFSKSLDDVVVLTTKLRIARTGVANLLEPLDREVRSD